MGEEYSVGLFITTSDQRIGYCLKPKRSYAVDSPRVGINQKDTQYIDPAVTAIWGTLYLGECYWMGLLGVNINIDSFIFRTVIGKVDRIVANRRH